MSDEIDDDRQSRPESEAPQAEEHQDRPGILSRIFGGRRQGSLRADLAEALESSDDDTESFSATEKAMLNNILRLREVRVEDVMIPRGDIEGVEINTTLGELMVLLETSGRSRMPVYADALDDPRGMVHIRDVLAHVTRKSCGREGPAPKHADGHIDTLAELADMNLTRIDLSKPLSELGLVRPVLFVPASMLAGDLMARMQAARIQMALVIDEYGGTDGLVSLEDIVEVVFGEIEDEHDDDEEPLISKRAEGVFIVDAKAEIENVASEIGEDFVADEEVLEDVDTVGGLLFNALGRVPARGEVVQAVPGWEFHVIDADPRRIKRVRIMRLRTDRRRRATRSGPETPVVPERGNGTS
ncbi:hemolysin family protein [Notoacmeibacter ruber]|uniref:HlyC/CorC family transporter n=1 Tax=Notoacmeibacter ruber TaxID=2670375 RepID=A0A3L7JBS3_9HYPH|nr:hemolysin family protein [Notoacmeibacter ruber]RLQ86981.1 HlyC/CorC family transporter [Notoacmeibacter ruber]